MRVRQGLAAIAAVILASMLASFFLVSCLVEGAGGAAALGAAYGNYGVGNVG